jgi:hypothetical protein
MLADDTIPAEDRRAAAKALLALFKRRQGQFVSADELANVKSGGTVSTTPTVRNTNIPAGWSHETLTPNQVGQ